MVDKENYGTVIILKGRHKGVVGYYDDDLSDTMALVYVGAALFQKGLEIKREHLKATPKNVVSLSLKRLLTKHPEVREYFGIIERGVK